MLHTKERGYDLPLNNISDVGLSPWDEREYSDVNANLDLLLPQNRHRLLDRKPGEPLPDRNEQVDMGNWDQPFVFGEGDAKPFTRLQVHEGDPALVRIVEEEEDDEEDEIKPRLTISLTNLGGKRKKKSNRPVPKKLIGNSMMDLGLDVYNMSNDKKYEDLKESKKRVRQTFGSLEVQHSWPALKLQLPFVSLSHLAFLTFGLLFQQYRTSLNKSECRSYHRPGLQFPLNMPITFNKVRSAKKKKEKNATAGNRGGKADNPIKNTDELSIRDTSQFVLMEYSVRPFAS